MVNATQTYGTQSTSIDVDQSQRTGPEQSRAVKMDPEMMSSDTGWPMTNDSPTIPGSHQGPFFRVRGPFDGPATSLGQF